MTPKSAPSRLPPKNGSTGLTSPHIKWHLGWLNHFSTDKQTDPSTTVTSHQCNLTNAYITVCASGVNMHCLSYYSQHTRVTVHLCCLLVVCSLCGFSIRLFSKCRSLDVRISLCNDGHIFHGGKFNIQLASSEHCVRRWTFLKQYQLWVTLPITKCVPRRQKICCFGAYAVLRKICCFQLLFCINANVYMQMNYMCVLLRWSQLRPTSHWNLSLTQTAQQQAAV